MDSQHHGNVRMRSSNHSEDDDDDDPEIIVVEQDGTLRSGGNNNHNNRNNAGIAKNGTTASTYDSVGYASALTTSPTSKLTPMEVEMLPLTHPQRSLRQQSSSYRPDDDDEAVQDLMMTRKMKGGGGDDPLGKERTLYPVEIGADNSTSAHLIGWRRSVHDWLFPPHLPRTCQLLRKENLAVPACYLLVGVLQGLSSPLINVFPLDLGATEAQQTTVSSIRSLPASFKLVFGFLSDNLPLAGYRRKPVRIMREDVGWYPELEKNSAGDLIGDL